MLAKQFAARTLLCLFVILFVTVVASHCSTTSSLKNSLGTVSYASNPYIYLLVGDVKDVATVDGNLSLRVNPLYTYMLYDENVLLCGLPVEKFAGASGPFVMTYERRSHRLVNGVGCHELLKVDPVLLRRQP